MGPNGQITFNRNLFSSQIILGEIQPEWKCQNSIGKFATELELSSKYWFVLKLSFQGDLIRRNGINILNTKLVWLGLSSLGGGGIKANTETTIAFNWDGACNLLSIYIWTMDILYSRGKTRQFQHSKSSHFASLVLEILHSTYEWEN